MREDITNLQNQRKSLEDAIRENRNLDLINNYEKNTLNKTDLASIQNTEKFIEEAYSNTKHEELKTKQTSLHFDKIQESYNKYILLLNKPTDLDPVITENIAQITQEKANTVLKRELEFTPTYRYALKLIQTNMKHTINIQSRQLSKAMILTTISAKNSINFIH